MSCDGPTPPPGESIRRMMAFSFSLLRNLASCSRTGWESRMTPLISMMATFSPPHRLSSRMAKRESTHRLTIKRLSRTPKTIIPNNTGCFFIPGLPLLEVIVFSRSSLQAFFQHPAEIGSIIIIGGRRFFPRRRGLITIDIFDAQADLVFLRIHIDDHSLNIVPHLGNFRGLLHPLMAEFRNMHQPLDPRLDLHKGAELGDIRYLSFDQLAHLEPVVHLIPWVFLDLLDPQRKTLIFFIDIQYDGLNL